MMVLAAVLLIGMIVSMAWAPETRNLTLRAASGSS
jgi:MFS transporter, putative metabolite transport protein